MDVDKVRNELVNVITAAKYDWGIRHRENQDDLGPLTIVYVGDNINVLIDGTILGTYPAQTGQEVFDGFNTARNKVAAEAWALWNTRLCRYIFRRRVSWKELLEHAGGKNKRGQLLFALVMLRSGAYQRIKSFGVLPPVLSQQRDAVTLPRIDKPGYPDRAFYFEVHRG